jgi:hypothetical protein
MLPISRRPGVRNHATTGALAGRLSLTFAYVVEANVNVMQAL